MHFDGQWLLCDDGIRRPIMRCEVLADDGQWRTAEFLVDTGADRTVFSKNVLEAVALSGSQPGGDIRGVGGIVPTIAVKTQICMTREDNGKVLFRGEFVGCLDKDALDMSVLGRDITQMFTVIVDRPSDSVLLLGQGHSYLIQKQ